MCIRDRGIYVTESMGHISYYNCVVDQTSSSSNAISNRNLSYGSSTSTVENCVVYGNDGADHAIYLTEQVAHPVVKNNIICYIGTTGIGMYITSKTSGTSQDVTYRDSVYNNTCYNVTSSTRYGSNLLTTYPVFADTTNGYYGNGAGSPSIDSGTQGDYAHDKYGTTRPQNSVWDRGITEQ